jgi:hypothetical protein
VLFDRFATVMIAIGAGLGLAATSTIPTHMPEPERSYPAARQEAYPEITAVTYESYPVAQAPIFHRPMRLAYWEQPWEEPLDVPAALADAEYADHDFAPDPQVVEDEDVQQPIQADAELRNEPVELTLASHP